jgi:ribose 5-phosphate isomerase A
VTAVDALAIAAVAEIRSGMAVGLGTGRAATRAIHALARRALAEHLSLVCVATSEASSALGQELGLRVQPLESSGRIDYLFDGADEVDPFLRMLKGRGGAMTRERLVAHAATRRVYLVQTAKLVARLGETAPLPIEILHARLATVQSALATLGLTGTLRERDRVGREGARYLTDGGNPVLDVVLPAHVVLEDLAKALDTTPGVVGHGLFLDEAELVLIEDDQGRVSRRSR